jgi:protein-S-isoprenylcysteine O-methyltransferase Ste14
MTAVVRDTFERLCLAALVGWLAFRIGVGILTGEESIVALFVLAGELIVLGFVIFGRPAVKSSASTKEWLIAFAGTSAPTFVVVGGTPLLPLQVVFWVCLTGLSLQIAAKINLNRSFGIVPANRGVVTDGFYSIVRHPVYASYLVGHVGFLLLNPNWWNLAVYTAGLSFQVSRMIMEEGLLSQDPAYAAYRQHVRYRLVPGVF